MRKFFGYVLPILAGAAIAFYVLPNFGGNLEIFVEKVAIDWEISILAMRIILAVALALVLCIVFGLLAKIAIWFAVIIVLVAVFAPAFLKDLPIVSDDVKNFVTEKVQELKE